MKKHKVKKRYIFLLIAVAGIIIGFFVYAVNVGRTYSLLEVTGYNSVDLNTVKAESSDENVIKVTSVSQDRREDGFYYLTFVLESAGSGDCTLNVSYAFLEEDGGELIESEKNLSVLPFGTIFDSTNKSFTALHVAIPVFLLIILLVLTVLSVSFAEKLRKGDFSYLMVVLGGVILYLLLSFIVTLLIVI